MIEGLLPTGVRAVKTRELGRMPDLAQLSRDLDDGEHGCVLFESAEPHPVVGRYSYLSVRPVWEITARRSGAELRMAGAEPRALAVNGIELLRELLGSPQWPDVAATPVPFCGGLAGYLSYELHELFEPSSATSPARAAAPDFALARIDWLVAVDAQSGTAWLIANGFGADDREAERAAGDLLDEVWLLVEPLMTPARLRAPSRSQGWLDPSELGLKPATTRDQYLEQVAETQRRIVAGDVYEVCLSQRFEGKGEIDPHTLYDAVIAENPAPMSAMLRLGGADIVSASFERFLRIDADRGIETRPVKGTRPRAADAVRDGELKRDLSASAKDRAENVMAVDVARNDLGRVSDYGTVEVTELCSVESYRVTHQLVSTVRGRLFERMTAFDALKAAFPGASMTGAPKIQAMLTIAQLEPVARGVFAGSLIWSGYDGQCDASIVIRTFVQQDGLISLHVGGAVIADSIPEDEYDETLQKAQGMLRALAACRPGATSIGG